MTFHTKLKAPWILCIIHLALLRFMLQKRIKTLLWTLLKTMKTLLTRSISGLIFITIVIGSILWNEKAVLLFFTAISGIGLYEFHNLYQSKKKLIYPIWISALMGVLSFIALIYPIYFDRQQTVQGLVDSCLLILVLFILYTFYQLWSNRSYFLTNLCFIFFGLSYVVAPLYMGALIHLSDHSDFPILLGLFILVWSNDTFAYLFGNLFGKNKLVERISPNKTWEGFLGGYICTIFIGYALDTQIFGANLFWVKAAIIVSPAAVLGDLFESLLKRKNNVKDTGNIMPGHGGILDRFDAMFFAIPFFYLWLIIYSYL